MATAPVLARLTAAANAATQRLGDLSAAASTPDDDQLSAISAKLEQAVAASQPAPQSASDPSAPSA